MKAIDTNIIIRFLTQDDGQQYEQIIQLFEEESLFISDTVILETEWVLRSAFGFPRTKIVEALKRLFGLPNIHTRNGVNIIRLIELHGQGLDFADAFHLLNSEHLSELITFDERFIKRAKNKTACLVRKP